MGSKVRRLFTDERSKFVAKNKHIIITWGNSRYFPHLEDTRETFNCISNVSCASNKLLAFYLLFQNPDINIPEWTEDRDTAKQWLVEGSRVLGRSILTGHSGAGILVFEDALDWDNHQECPLYTKYIKKKKEFRVHVAFDKVIDIQQKKKRVDFEGTPSSVIRNHDNGWVYCREGIVIPDDLENQARLAVSQLGLDFGAVDIIWNEHYNKCYVLEVNTAPGIEGTTVDKYADAFVEKINGLNTGTT